MKESIPIPSFQSEIDKPTRLSRVEDSIVSSVESIFDDLKLTVAKERELHPELREDIDNISRLLLLKGERDLRYWMKKRNDVGEKFLREFSLSGDFFRRKFFELLGIMQSLPREGSVLDLACGTGDIAILAALRGQETFGVELDSSQVRMGNFYAQQLGVAVDIRQLNLVQDALPVAKHWVAKHPCARNMALPDEIIARWVQDSNATDLVCMTCCQGKAQDCFPGYSGISSDEWKQFCKISDWTNNDDQEKQKKGQRAMDAIDRLRVGVIREQGLSAHLEIVANTIKGNIIVASKNPIEKEAL